VDSEALEAFDSTDQVYLERVTALLADSGTVLSN